MKKRPPARLRKIEGGKPPPDPEKAGLRRALALGMLDGVSKVMSYGMAWLMSFPETKKAGPRGEGPRPEAQTEPELRAIRRRIERELAKRTKKKGGEVE